MFLKINVKGRSFIFYEKLFFYHNCLSHTTKHSTLFDLQLLFINHDLLLYFSLYIHWNSTLSPSYLILLIFQLKQICSQKLNSKESKESSYIWNFLEIQYPTRQRDAGTNSLQEFITFVYLKMLILTIFTFCLRKEA